VELLLSLKLSFGSFLEYVLLATSLDIEVTINEWFYIHLPTKNGRVVGTFCF